MTCPRCGREMDTLSQRAYLRHRARILDAVRRLSVPEHAIVVLEEVATTKPAFELNDLFTQWDGTLRRLASE